MHEVSSSYKKNTIVAFVSDSDSDYDSDSDSDALYSQASL